MFDTVEPEAARRLFFCRAARLLFDGRRKALRLSNLLSARSLLSHSFLCLVPPGSTCFSLPSERERRSDERGARSPAKLPKGASKMLRATGHARMVFISPTPELKCVSIASARARSTSK